MRGKQNKVVPEVDMTQMTSFIWNTQGKAKGGEMFVKKLKVRALETDCLSLNPGSFSYRIMQSK